MRRSHLITALLLFLFIGGFWYLQHISQNPSESTSSVKHVLGTNITSVPAKPSICHEKNGLPDPICTPGSTNPNVTQENIDSTICASGYTKTIRPPSSYTQALKKQQIQEYGYTDTIMKDFEEDHLISLELGGNPTDPKNLWPEPGASPNPKDNIENLCNEKVCNGQISLLEAQKEIANNWTTACQ